MGKSSWTIFKMFFTYFAQQENSKDLQIFFVIC